MSKLGARNIFSHIRFAGPPLQQTSSSLSHCLDRPTGDVETSGPPFSEQTFNWTCSYNLLSVQVVQGLQPKYQSCSEPSVHVKYIERVHSERRSSWDICRQCLIFILLISLENIWYGHRLADILRIWFGSDIFPDTSC